MTNNDPSPPAPALWHSDDLGVADWEPVLIEDGICGTCGYQLKVLAEHGTCPECGVAYTPATMSPLATSPGALEIVLRFFWPLILLALLAWWSFAGGGARDPYAGIGFMLMSIPVLAVLFPLNSLLQVYLMARRHVRPAHRSRLAGRNAQMLGMAAKATFYATAVVPPLIVGGCVLVMCGGGL